MHVRAEQLSKLGRTDVRVSCGRLLITIDIPLLDESGYQLYEIYAHPVCQQISTNTTGSIYIISKMPYNALANDERKFFLISKEYFVKKHFTTPFAKTPSPSMKFPQSPHVNV